MRHPEGDRHPAEERSKERHEHAGPSGHAPGRVLRALKELEALEEVEAQMFAHNIAALRRARTKLDIH